MFLGYEAGEVTKDAVTGERGFDRVSDTLYPAGYVYRFSPETVKEGVIEKYILTFRPVYKEGSAVSFDANGGTGTMNPGAAVKGETWTLPVCAFTAPDGMVFEAWEIDGKKYIEGDEVEITANTTAKAVYADVSGKAHSITSADYAGGAIGAFDEPVFEGATVDFDARANRGYAIARVMMNGAELEPRQGSTQEDGSYEFTMPTHDVVLSAEFKPIAYSIAYELNGGAGNGGNPATYTVASGDIKLVAATGDTCFDGWYDNASLKGEPIAMLEKGSYGDIALYAKWNPTARAWDSGKVAKATTYTAAGSKTFICTVCGATKTEAIPKLVPVKLTWKKPAGAAKYVVYGAKGTKGAKMKKLATVKGASKKAAKVAGAKLKPGTRYKFYVKALDAKGKTLCSSAVVSAKTKRG
ncbi:MAG TPA: hypothetical protein DCP91_05800 [Eggerthellaceae bacterium]|nr:hypothetical protein [Eggerthellaceae bacterium]